MWVSHRKYHLETLKISIEEANKECINLEEKTNQIQIEKEKRLEAHKENIRNLAEDMKFD